MKRLISLAVLLIVLALCLPTVALADGPEGNTNVSVDVTTPGNVNLGVGIDAGGTVNVNVNGVSINGLQNQVDKLSQNNGDSGLTDWIIHVFGQQFAPYSKFLAQLSSTVNLLTDAEAKLISGQQLGQAQIDYINTSVKDLQSQDEKTWDQLMNGAEYHLSLMDSRVSADEAQIADLKTQLANAERNNVILSNYTDYLQRQYQIYFWILGGVVVVLAVLLLAGFLYLRRR